MFWMVTLMDRKTAIKYMLRKFKDKSIGKKELQEIKEYIVKKTGEGKYTSLTTIRKWVNEVRKEMRAKSKKRKEKKGLRIAQKTKSIKEEIYAKPIEVEPSPEERKIAAIQNITYEMAAIRQLLQRINKQLDSVETLLKQIEE